MDCQHVFEIINIGSYEKERTIGFSSHCCICNESLSNYITKLKTERDDLVHRLAIANHEIMAKDKWFIKKEQS